MVSFLFVDIDGRRYVHDWWDDYDIRNLKDLILHTVSWIHSDILTRKYKSEMP
jgi:hypothetical protein